MNFNKILLCLLFPLLTFTFACDCFLKVKGTVTDFETGKPIPGIPVFNKKKDWNKTLTDSNGHFSLSTSSGLFCHCPPMTVVIRTPEYKRTEVKIPAGESGNIQLKKLKDLYFKDSNCLKNSMMLNGEKVYAEVDKPATFPGGPEKCFNYISGNIRYPTAQKEWQATVYVTFIVDTFGMIRNECIYFRNDLSAFTPCELEVLRLIREMPKWTAAEIKGIKVNSRVTLPVRIQN